MGFKLNRFVLLLVLFCFGNLSDTDAGEATALDKTIDWNLVVSDFIKKSCSCNGLSFEDRNKLAELAVSYANQLNNDTLYIHAILNHSKILISQGYYNESLDVLQNSSSFDQNKNLLLTGFSDSSTSIFISGFILAVFISCIALFIKKNKKKKDKIEKLKRTIEEKDSATKALKHSEGKFYSLIRTLNEGFIHTDTDSNIKFLNEKACFMLGGIFDDMINRSLREFVLGREDMRIFEEKLELQEKGIADQYELQLKKNDGGSIWVNFSMAPLFDDSGNWIGSVNIITDITRRKKYDESMKELTASLNRKIKQLDCLYDISDLTSIPGITFEEIFNRSLKIIPFGLKYAHDTFVEIVFENQVFHSENFKKTEWCYTVPIKVQKKKLGHIYVCYMEEKPFVKKDPFHFNEKILIKNIAEKLGQIIESKNMEMSLKENQQKLSLARKIARIGDWEWDFISNTKKYSDSFFEVLGIPVEKKIFFDDEMFFKLIHPDDRKKIKQIFRKISNNDFSVLRSHFTFVHLTGAERYIYMTGELILGENHKPEKIIFTIQDITDQNITNQVKKTTVKNGR